MTLQKRVPIEEALRVEGPDASLVAPESVFDLANILRLLRTRWPIIIGASLIVIAATALVVYRMTPLYTASALVMLDTHQNRLVNAAALQPRDDADAFYGQSGLLENQVQILTSRTLAARVIDKLQLDKDPIFNPPAPPSTANVRRTGVLEFLAQLNPRQWLGKPPVSVLTDEQRATNEREAIIDRLLSNLTARARGFSTAIDISYVDIDPVRSALIANAFADAYVQDQLNAKYEASQTATQWLFDRIQSLTDQVRDADVAVQQYKAANNLTDTNGSSIVDQQASALNTQLISARSDLADQEAKYARVVELQKAGHAEDISQVVNSPLIGALRAQENDLLKREADFSTRYGPRHPKVLDLESEKRNLITKMNEEVQRVVATVANDVAVSRARLKSLESSLQQATSRITGDNKSRIKLRELEANAASSHALHDAFLSRFKETQGQEGIQAPDSRVISRAVIPTTPSAPNISAALRLAGGSGLLLGLLMALMVERLDSGFRTATQTEKTLGLPVLSTIPEISWGQTSAQSACERVIDKPMSSYAEAIRGLNMSLVLSNVDRPPQVVLVTSAVPGEGKTTAAISLARLVAQTGKKVLIIDCDLRRPSVARALGINKFDKGLVEVLSGAHALENCLEKDPRSPMQLLPVKLKSGNPPDLLGSEAMERLITGLRSNFDLIVLDSAPLLPVNDTRIMARLADAIMFVVRWEKTPREAVRNAARILADSQAHVTGIVLTRANAKRFQNYSYGYQSYRAYNKYYGS